MSSAQPTFQTKSSRVYETLKQNITNGDYKPGHHLVRRGLVKEFGVSLSIVNEALARLASDGLVESKEMYGTRVIDLDEHQLQGEFMLREAVERQAVRLLVQNASDGVLETLHKQARKLDAELAAGHDQDLSLTHFNFHIQMVEAAGFPQLSETLERTGIRSLMTTRWLVNQEQPHPPNFHARLVKTVLKRDPVAADAEILRHLHYRYSSGGTR